MTFIGRAVVMVAVVTGCAGKAAGPAKSAVELVLAYDGAAPAGTVAFPSAGYESVLRFDLPPGEHRLERLYVQAAAPGTLELTVYDSSPLEAPGQVIHSISRAVAPGDVSDGKDGRWLVDDLGALAPRE